MTEARELLEGTTPVPWSVSQELNDESAPLLDRLQRRYCEDSGGARKTWSRNPDGHDAARQVTHLTDGLERCLGRFEATGDTHGQSIVRAILAQGDKA